MFKVTHPSKLTCSIFNSALKNPARINMVKIFSFFHDTFYHFQFWPLDRASNGFISIFKIGKRRCLLHAVPLINQYIAILLIIKCVNIFFNINYFTLLIKKGVKSLCHKFKFSYFYF